MHRLSEEFHDTRRSIRLRRTVRAAGLAGRLTRLADRWSRDFSTRVEEYSFLTEPGIRPPLRRSLRGHIEVTEHRVPLYGFPEALDGLRVVQLTDIHHGLYLPLHDVIEAVELANRLNPDIVALTGDFVTYSRAYIDPMAEILGHLRAKHGVFAVLGNHDFRVGPELVTRALRRDGIEVLRNRHTKLHIDGHGLAIAGIDDVLYGANLLRALNGIRHGWPVILLSHNPKIIRRAAQHKVSLVLSGHTHGGQVQLPVMDSLLRGPRRRIRFTSGWDVVGPTQIYVSRGIGTVVLPVRFRCPAEIPQFHLYSHDSHSRPAA
jgi:hypothetical protein